MPPGRRIALFALVWLALAGRGQADERLGDVSHDLFVIDRDSSSVAVIDTATDRLVGRLELGLTARQIQLSKALAKLVAIDGLSGRLIVRDLASGRVDMIPLDFVPNRVLVAPDGTSVAVAGDDGGRIVAYDLPSLRQIGRIDGPPRVRDLIWGEDSRTLFVVSEGFSGVAVVDVAGGRVKAVVATPPGVVLARSPNGREAFVLGPGGVLTRFRLERLTVVDQMPVGDATLLAVSGTGQYAMLADAGGRTFLAASTDPLQPGVRSSPGRPVAALYSGWFDVFAFVAGRDRVSAYDLETGRAAGVIALDGRPGPGTVTPEGGKLYLPIEDEKQIAVIDTRYRRLVATVPLGFHPKAAVMAGGYGICH
jgi:DNA-binding beta-propeller fold protein YncE